MTLARRLTMLLAFASVLAGLSWAWWQHQSLRAERLQEETRVLEEAEAALHGLDRDLRRYEEAKTQVGADTGFARHEKVAIAARLSPAELARLNEILQRAYSDEGFLLLKNFTLSWSESRELSLQLAGEKVFIR